MTLPDAYENAYDCSGCALQGSYLPTPVLISLRPYYAKMTTRMVLGCGALSGTDLPDAMSGTDLPYAMSGTDLAYAPMRCMVLT
eukprot:2555705-Rhodomonas_salina.2